MDVERGIRPSEVTEAGTGPVTMVRAVRLARGIGQRELARRSGVARESLARIERGQGSPTLTTCERLAAELGVGIGVLFGGRPEDRDAALAALREVERARRS